MPRRRQNASCQGCGARIAAGDAFCRECGQRLVPRVATRRRLSPRAGLGILGVLALLVLVGRLDGNQDDSATSQPNQAANLIGDRVMATAAVRPFPTNTVTARVSLITTAAPTSVPTVTVRPTGTTGITPTAAATVTATPAPEPTGLSTLKSSSTAASRDIASLSQAEGVEVPDGVPDGAMEAKVLRIVDGDTIDVGISGHTVRVRLIGIDTPETKDPNDPVECYGAEATTHTTGMLGGRTVWLEKDVSEIDRYERLLRYVWVVPKSGGAAYFANEQLVRDGYAMASRFPPDVKYAERLRDAERDARDAGRGLWDVCGGADTPLEPTATPRPRPSATPRPRSTPTPKPALIAECGGFGSFEEANVYYRAHPEVQPSIDPNGDGRACEIFFGVDAPQPPPDAPQGVVDPGGATNPYAGGDLDCADFATHAEAQAAWEANGGSAANNVWGLDRNHDGVACESLP